jgi:SRSO17 transposase
VPQTIALQTKPEIALAQIKAARAAGLPEGVVLMDAGYGNETGPERHIPNSIATLRRRLIVALARTLPRCPCCNLPIRKTLRIPDY